MSVKQVPLVIVQGGNSQFDKLDKIFESANLEYTVLNSSAALLALLSEYKPVILLMDLLIDEKDAIDILQELERLEERELMTVVVFGDSKEGYVEIASLNAGADDYCTKPVNKRIFASRLNTWVRKQGRFNRAMGHYMMSGIFNIDRERYSLVVRNHEINLQRKEFEIMALLASRPRKVFTRKEIKEIVWGDVEGARNRTIDVHITNLRAKVGPEFIRTYKGVGYSFHG